MEGRSRTTAAIKRFGAFIEYLLLPLRILDQGQQLRHRRQVPCRAFVAEAAARRGPQPAIDDTFRTPDARDARSESQGRWRPSFLEKGLQLRHRLWVVTR